MNLCELKVAESQFTVDKADARELKRERDVFHEATGTRKALFVTLVTSSGARENEHSRGLLAQAISLDALFAGEGP